MSSQRPPRGLATLALLRVRFDGGQDHLGLLEPFMQHVLSKSAIGAYTANELSAGILAEFGLSVPADVSQLVLTRLVRPGLLDREGGKYWLRAPYPANATLVADRESSTKAFEQLGQVFVEYSKESGSPISSVPDALAIICAFLVDNDVTVLLDDLLAPADDGLSGLSSSRTKLTARFLKSVVFETPALRETLESLLRGVVLQNALLLRNIAERDRRLDGLRVFLDTGFLFALVGAKGDVAETAARESLRLLRDVGADPVVLDRTIAEMQRILSVYERHLGSAEGRLSLYATELTAHFLSSRATPSEVRQLSGLLKAKISALGISVRPMPSREAAFTANEPGLARALARPEETGQEPRIQHDVDVVAAVLLARRNRYPTSLEDSVAIFATTSGLVVRSVNQWFRAEGGTGISPIIHQVGLTNVAWLKRPAAATHIQLYELAAACEAALRPTRSQWEKFNRILRELRDRGDVSTDEAVAMAAEGLTFAYLEGLEVDVEPDASDVADVAERLRAKYRAETIELIESVKVGAERDRELLQDRIVELDNQSRRQEGRVFRFTGLLASLLAGIVSFVLFGLLVAGVALATPGLIDGVPDRYRRAGLFVSVVSGLVQVYGAFLGGSILGLHRGMRDQMMRWLLRVF